MQKIDLKTDIYDLFQYELLSIEDMMRSCFSDDVSQINTIGEYLLLAPGKRIRPLLLLLITRIFNYHNHQETNLIEGKCIKIAAAIELVHIGTLVHDDVVDDSIIRRFRPSINARWGNMIAVLAGDFIFCAAFELTILSHATALKILSAALAAIVRGEVIQLSYWRNKTYINEYEYYNVVQAKTCALFEATLDIAGLLSKQKISVRKNLRKMGTHIGTIFQIADDYLDYFCTTEITGKSQFNDFLEGKITMPIIMVLAYANREERAALDRMLLQEPVRTLSDAQAVLALLQKYEIHKLIAKKLFQMYEEFHAFAAQVLPNNQYTHYVDAIIMRIINQVTNSTI